MSSPCRLIASTCRIGAPHRLHCPIGFTAREKGCGGTVLGTAAGMSTQLPCVLDMCPSGRDALPVPWCGWPVIDGSTSRGCSVFMLGPWGRLCVTGNPLGCPWSRGPLSHLYSRAGVSGSAGPTSLLLGSITGELDISHRPPSRRPSDGPRTAARWGVRRRPRRDGVRCTRPVPP